MATESGPGNTCRRLLVTGAAGFIGARVSALLLEQGVEVTGLDNLNDAYDPRLKEHRLRLLSANSGFRFLRLDISDRTAMQGLFSEEERRVKGAPFHAVLNLGGRAGIRASVKNPWVYFETNVTGTLNLLDACREHGVKKFVLASSSSVYGADCPVPFRETATADRPLSPYAASKKAAENLAHSYHHLHALDVCVLRYFTAYGPGGRPDMAPFLFTRAVIEGEPLGLFGDGTQSRDFTYVDDIARGTISAISSPGYSVFNLGSDRPIPVLEFIAEIERAAGRKAAIKFLPPHPADVGRTWADISQARSNLGWTPQTSLQEGVSELVAWYRRERDWLQELNLALPA